MCFVVLFPLVVVSLVRVSSCANTRVFFFFLLVAADALALKNLAGGKSFRAEAELNLP